MAAALLLFAAAGRAAPWCAWLPTEYGRPAGRALEKDYAARKPLVNVESDYFGHGLVKPYGVEDVRLDKAIPAGRYRLEWIDPGSGAIKESKRLNWRGGDLRVTTPAYSLDVALRMRATPAR